MKYALAALSALACAGGLHEPGFGEVVVRVSFAGKTCAAAEVSLVRLDLGDLSQVQHCASDGVQVLHAVPAGWTNPSVSATGGARSCQLWYRRLPPLLVRAGASVEVVAVLAPAGSCRDGG